MLAALSAREENRSFRCVTSAVLFFQLMLPQVLKYVADLFWKVVGNCVALLLWIVVWCCKEIVHCVAFIFLIVFSLFLIVLMVLIFGRMQLQRRIRELEDLSNSYSKDELIELKFFIDQHPHGKDIKRHRTITFDGRLSIQIHPWDFYPVYSAFVEGTIVDVLSEFQQKLAERHALSALIAFVECNFVIVIPNADCRALIVSFLYPQ